jgi:uncharacterized membrane protein YuzA (DUF378 family)
MLCTINNKRSAIIVKGQIIIININFLNKMKVTHCVSFILLAIGGLNWGLVGLGSWFGGNWNIVNLLFGSWPGVESTIYVLVGIATIVLIATHKKSCKHCEAGAAAPTM